jgi:fructokinase
MRLGVDLGGTKTEIIALNDSSEELYRHRTPSAQNSYAATIDTITRLVVETENKLQKTGTVGIGIPGAISAETGLIKNANSTWLIGHDLQKDLSTALGRPVLIANDADCFTLSEAIDGAGQGAASVFGVILGTGVGGGFYIHGAMHHGPNAIAGEWGHNPLPPDNRQHTASQPEAVECYCGKLNCNETFLSGPAFLNHYLKLNPSATYASAKELAIAINNNQATALTYYDIYLDRLARGLSGIINTIDPEVFVFGGGLSNINSLYQDLPTAIMKYIFSDSVRTQFCKAKYGDSSGVRGAAWLTGENAALGFASHIKEQKPK